MTECENKTDYCTTCKKAWTDECERAECWEHEYCKYKAESTSHTVTKEAQKGDKK